jgi:hypothetical protein
MPHCAKKYLELVLFAVEKDALSIARIGWKIQVIFLLQRATINKHSRRKEIERKNQR